MKRTFTLLRRIHPQGVTTVEVRQWFPLAAFAGALAWYIVAPSAVALMGLVGLGGLLLVAFLWARALALGARGERRLHYAAVQVGDELEEHIALDNATRLPMLWAEFVDRSDIPGYTVASVRSTGTRSAIHWRTHTLCARRGVFTLGPWELLLGDPFDFFLVRHTYTHRQELLVYPPLAALPADLTPLNSTLGDYRRLRQPLRAETINAISTRAYHPGDPLRHLHWPTIARREALFTRVFEPEASSRIWLVLDLDRAAHCGAGDDATEEAMVVLAASLAEQLLRRRLTVGLLARTEALNVVRPQAGVIHLWQFLRALAPLHPTCDLPLARTLTEAQSLFSARDLVIIVTPSLVPDWLRSLHQFPARGRAGAEVVLLDAASFGGQGNAQACAASLRALGVPTQIVRRGDVRPLPATYGALRRWDFVTFGTGHAIARQTPRPHTGQKIAAVLGAAR
jgi:uncharacterized protein (DUF58 family)